MTRICAVIKWYEEAVWHYLSDVFRFGLKASELGITNDLVYRITEFYGGRPANCEVYAFNDNVFEARRGTDIDLFIEDKGTGYYHFFMLQAKMMDYKGRYYDIKRWSLNGQYHKLIRNSKKEGAFPLYLLYNGRTVSSRLGASKYGLSIVEAIHVKNLRLGQRRMNQAPLITFDQLYPLDMEPFHVLFCDIPDKYKLPKAIEGSSIYRGYPYINKTEPKNENIDDSLESNTNFDKGTVDIIKGKNLAPVRLIIKSE